MRKQVKWHGELSGLLYFRYKNYHKAEWLIMMINGFKYSHSIHFDFNTPHHDATWLNLDSIKYADEFEEDDVSNGVWCEPTDDERFMFNELIEYEKTLKKNND